MKRLLIYTALIFSVNFAFAQTDTLLQKKDKTVDFGPGKTHFFHAYFNFMFALPPSENSDADIFYGKTHSFSYGVRYKFKIANFFGVGAGINYTYYAWHFKQNPDKRIPSSDIYDKEKLKINTVGGDFYIRFKFGKNRNSPAGNYFDAGYYGEWDFADLRQYKNFDGLPGTGGYSTFVGEEKNLNFLNKTNHGAEFRLGYGKLILFLKYRLSDMFTTDFKNTVSDTELQRLSAGLEIGFHK